MRILRSCGRPVAKTTLHRASAPAAFRIAARRFSSSSASSAAGHGAAAAAPTAHPLAGVASQLDHIAPRFEIDPDDIQILDSPTAFYETLKVPSSSR